MKQRREALARAAREDDRARRAVRVASVLAEALDGAGCRPVLVGGAAVEIYTRAAYTTFDLDFVAAETEELDPTMRALGFEREGRHWVQREYGVVVEFPATTLAPARAESMVVEGRTLSVISVEDLIVDRLASWKHWGWGPDGAAAALLLALHPRRDNRRLNRRANQEDVLDALRALEPLAMRGDELDERTLKGLRGTLEGTGR